MYYMVDRRGTAVSEFLEVVYEMRNVIATVNVTLTAEKGEVKRRKTVIARGIVTVIGIGGATVNPRTESVIGNARRRQTDTGVTRGRETGSNEETQKGPTRLRGRPTLKQTMGLRDLIPGVIVVVMVELKIHSANEGELRRMRSVHFAIH